MADEQVLETPVEEIDNGQQQNAGGETFLNNFWNDTPVPVKKEEPAQQQQQQQQPIKKDDEGILDPKDWLKREFEVDDPEVLKEQIKEYRQLKEKPPVAEYKFENEESRKMADAIAKGDRKEVLRILQTQDRIEQLTSAEITKENAADIIKMGMQLKHPDLTADEINHKYNKQFGIPKEPVQKADELDEEFNERKQQWEEIVREREMERTIEAKMYKPELENAKTKLVLPEIKNQVQATELTPEQVHAMKKDQEAFLQVAQTAVDAFTGFSTQVKDKDVDFPVNYALSKEEKSTISERFKVFAESNFDANFLFADRWVKDGKLNEAQMIEDLSRVFAGKSADAKIATDAANQRLELFLKEKKNIRVDANKGDFTPEAKSQSQKLQENFWGG